MAIRLAEEFYDAWCPAGWSWGNGLAPFVDYDLWCVRDGAGTISVDGAPTRPLARGTCIVFRPGMTVRAEHDPKRPLRVFARHFMVTGKDLELIPMDVKDVREMALYDALFDRMGLAHRDGNMPLVEQLLRTVLHALRDELSSDAPDAYAPYMKQGLEAVDRLLREHPERRYANGELARMAGLHENYFIRAFTRYFGHPPRQAAMRIRCGMAQQLLRESNLSIKGIAAALGYPDQASFSKQFRGVTGQSPLALRQRHGG